MSTFVENRLKEIRQCTDTELRYVSTDINPAGIASRGTHFSEIKSNNLWWNGPSWLLLSNDQWPTWSYNLTTENVYLYKSEIKPSTSYQQTELVGEPLQELIAIKKLESPYSMKCEIFSNLIRLLRITAWVQRFIRKQKKDTISGSLTAKEIEDAKFMWIVQIQRKHFAKEIHDITKNKSSNIISQLGLTIDNSGLIRCVGRIEHADISENAKRPILLPKKESFTKLLIYNYHRNLLHVGVAQTLSQIRQKYWIPQGRSTVRHVLRTCGNCIRYEGGPYKMPFIPPLPKKRATESSPYTYTGIDYFGPLYVKTVNGSKKVWVCLYTCLVVRAIHLELMLDMTTDQFLLGFRRFVARCGTPIQII
ncbi:unnamed protein product [Mytilus coruscus]|uniref:Integrase zinc-binding domain-containing protein n=1 Tax=Mytilus coruscus TaxID=42192 RepID=A0A6J8DYR9_MYTCO|nr:unnamed protein product [Mytilus coruscus]